MSTTWYDLSRELAALLPRRPIVPHEGFDVVGLAVAVEGFAQPVSRTALCRFVIRVQPLLPSSDADAELIAAERTACEALVGDANPGVAEAARERLALLNDQIDADALEGHWIEIEEDGPLGSVSRRRRTDSRGEVVFGGVLMDAPIVVRSAVRRGVFRFFDVEVEPDSEAVAAIAEQTREHYEADGVVATLEDTGGRARLTIETQRPDLDDALVFYRFGEESGDLMLERSGTLLRAEAILDEPFTEARLHDPVFEIEAAAEVVVFARGRWHVLREKLAAALEIDWTRATELSATGCVVGGMLVRALDTGVTFGGGARCVEIVSCDVPTEPPVSLRITLGPMESGEWWQLTIEPPVFVPGGLCVRAFAGERPLGPTQLLSRGNAEVLGVADTQTRWRLHFEWNATDGSRQAHDVELPMFRANV